MLVAVVAFSVALAAVLVWFLISLFQPFSGSSRPGGAGLGLAIARELAQAHGGDLSLIANGAAGAVFEVVLPGAPAAVKLGSRA